MVLLRVVLIVHHRKLHDFYTIDSAPARESIGYFSWTLVIGNVHYVVRFQVSYH